MKCKWLIPSALALLALALVILFSQGVGQAQTALTDLVVTKSVEPGVVSPEEGVIYAVTISNTTDVTVSLSSVVDTLPDGFEYVGLAPGSEWAVEPWDNTAPDIQWAGPITVPMSGALTLCYWVYVPETVPLSPEPYTNTVSATLEGDTYEAQAGLLVGIGEVSVRKAAAPVNVMPGESVTYTITFSNSGYVSVPLAVVTDVLPSDVTFVEMTADSDISAAPTGVTGTISWTDSFSIDPHAEFVAEYVATMPAVSDTLYLENEAWGRLGDDTIVGPTSTEVRVATSHPTTVSLPLILRNWAPAAFVAAKAASPTEAYAEEPGALITYTVTFENTGTDSGVLGDIRDTLPTGFTFVGMMPESDIDTSPTGTTGEIVWTGPFTVEGGGSLTLVYQVRASTEAGTYVNSATATVTEGYALAEPVTATVQLLEPFLLIEEFENPSPHWEEFLNYWRLNEEQWHYKPGASDDGSQALGHTFWFGVNKPDRGAHDALIMYKEPGAEQWADYTFQARAVLFFDDGTDRGQFGMWFRGTGDQEDQLPGRYVTGYYFVLKPGPPGRIYLMQLRTDEECGDDCDYNYHFSNPLELKELRGHSDLEPLGLSIEWGEWYWLKVEVQGPRIRCYVDDVLVFDYYDNVGTTFTEGTVGFFTYIAGDARFDHVSVEPLP